MRRRRDRGKNDDRATSALRKLPNVRVRWDPTGQRWFIQVTGKEYTWEYDAYNFDELARYLEDELRWSGSE